MAKITLVISDDDDGGAIVQFIPEPDFEIDEKITLAQDIAMQVMTFLEQSCEIEIDGPGLQELQ